MKSFTLIELILVVAIVAVLAGAIIPIINGAKESAAAAKMLKIGEALGTGSKLYHSDTGTLPIVLNGLIQDDGTPGWDGPYVDKIPTADDNPYGGISFGSRQGWSGGKYSESVEITFFTVPLSFAKKINDAIEPNEPGDWKHNGKARAGLICSAGVPPSCKQSAVIITIINEHY